MGFNPRPPSLAGDPLLRQGIKVLEKCFNPRPPSLAGDPFVKPSRPETPSCFNPRPPSLAGDPCFARPWAQADPVSIRARHHWRAIPSTTNSARLILSFNPRPPSLAGDPVAQVRRRAYRAVSIRARHHWRAIPQPSRSRSLEHWFQSAPAITGGRSGMDTVKADTATGFNPRPPSLAGDPPMGGVSVPESVRFQSAPAITGGRSSTAGGLCLIVILFQSAPAITGGRSDVTGVSKRWFDGVSIRARHHWRAILDFCEPRIVGGFVSIRARHHWRAIHCVPHPATVCSKVSIRARHHWRAIRQLEIVMLANMAFQSAPAITGGRSRALGYTSIDITSFQSAPAITGGRSGPVRHHRPDPVGFNPRPPSLAGDPRPTRSLPRSSVVSIRARHHWRAIRRVGQAARPDERVSIRARHHWRAIQEAYKALPGLSQFQSAPAITGGRSSHERRPD